MYFKNKMQLVLFVIIIWVHCKSRIHHETLVILFFLYLETFCYFIIIGIISSLLTKIIPNYALKKLKE